MAQPRPPAPLPVSALAVPALHGPDRGKPFLLLDDARPSDAAPARLYQSPRQIITAHRPDQLEQALADLKQAHRAGYQLAGYFAYEAGLALEPKLASRLHARYGASGPLCWFGVFDEFSEIAADAVPAWLASWAEPSPAPAISGLRAEIDAPEYARRFAAMHEAICAGDIYQSNFTFQVDGRYAGDPLALYAAIRPRAAAGHGGMLFDGQNWLLSFSPELFFTLKDSRVTVRPMKGTAARPADLAAHAAEDAQLRRDLAASVKDRAENLMIVDLMRNDLSRLAEPGSVSVDALFAIESYPSVHQMTSTIRARLPQGRDAFDLMRAIFPCGSITGAPKIRAMELIDDVESAARGPYCGGLGRIDADGSAAFNVMIRTLRLHADTKRVALGIGSAIVADSSAMAEWRECHAKGAFLRMAAPGCDLIETMAFDPAKGIALIELHLERMKASAQLLGFSFDRHAVRNAIHAACFHAEEPSRVRLMLARSGQWSIELSPMPAPLGSPVPVVLMPLPVAGDDWRLRHKTSDRRFYDEARQQAETRNAAEAVFVNEAGLITEGSFTNIFVQDDAGLITPALEQGLLPGVLRRSLIDSGEAKEGALTPEHLVGGFFIGNALRGLMPARLIAS